MTEERAVEILRLEMARNDHPVIMATVIGGLIKATNCPPGFVDKLVEIWREWRNDRDQGPIPDDWAISP